MAKAIERSGIPVAYVTTLTSLAEENRANRIVAGVRIPHPLGNPLLTSENELGLRTAVTRRALEVLAQLVDGPKVFSVDHPGAR
jgi:glycine reductase complex component B subunit gamma